ncbi:MAG: PIN domain-containing protein [Actinomycetota bacterium]|nr:PIN domain-containing protein [Actinomycetota bacterium]
MADEPAAEEVESLLREGDCRIALANLAEALDVAQRRHGLPLEALRTALDPLLLGPLAASAPSEADAWRAAELRGRYYDRNDRALSVADCFLLAQASAGGDAIATSDPPIAEVAQAEEIDVIGLPDSEGHRP